MLERLEGLRIIAAPTSLDAADWPEGATVFRLAADDVFLLGEGEVHLDDPHAIVDIETGFSGTWLSAETAAGWLRQNCEWAVPDERPAFAQGAVAGLPVKLLFEGDRVFVMTASALATDLEERMP